MGFLNRKVKTAKVLPGYEEEPILPPVPQPRKVEPVKEKNTATIVSAEIIEGMKIRSVIISDESIGEVGDSFELDEE